MDESRYPSKDEMFTYLKIARHIGECEIIYESVEDSIAIGERLKKFAESTDLYKNYIIDIKENEIKIKKPGEMECTT